MNSAIFDPSGFRIIYSGKFLNCDLAIVTDDPASLFLAWSMMDQWGDKVTGTIQLQEPEGVTPEMQMKIILASIKQDYESDQIARKVLAIRRGTQLQ